MKIAVFHNLPPGGAKRVVYEQVKGLLARHSVDLYQLSGSRPDFLDFRRLGCPVFSYDFSLTSHLPGPLARIHSDFKNFFMLDQFHRRLAADINSKGYDVILVHPDRYTQAPFLLKYLRPPGIYYCEELLRLGYEPELAISPGLSLPHRIYELATRRIRVSIDCSNARRAAHILTNSRYIKSRIAHAYNCDSVVCYPGVDPSVFSPQPMPKIKQFLFIGHPAPINGSDLIEQLHSPYVKIIDFTSTSHPLSDNDLAREYSVSLAVLCPSRHEPFGLAPLEAMACGTPVLAVNEGGYPETVVDGRTGWLLPRNAHAFADKMDYLLTHPRVVSRLAAAGRQQVISRWTWDRHVRQLEQFLIHAA